MEETNLRKLYTRTEFCKMNKISPSTFQKLNREGKGPKIIKLFGKILISEDAIQEWRDRMIQKTKGK